MMKRQTTQHVPPVRSPLSMADALALVMSGRTIDYAAMAKVGDVISGKPLAPQGQPA